MRVEPAAARVLSAEELRRRWLPEREAGRRLVFTNGCFDVLHAGHLSLLERAAALGDDLVVGLNSDDSVRRLKGPGRPLMGEADRAALLAALRPVDWVVLFAEDTPLRLIETLLPDILVKGADYAHGEIVGREVVEAHGGEVVRLPLVPGRSTSGLLARLRRPADPPGPSSAPRG
ncbi:MAG: D-glycero-beta-D-manno-heptose 1-phosphate adenylyltransferase [Candidatus Eisenbacteria sp.]|nr:D-glycero-beta-D-manno-heptose 1-phosphate adenylyltransferase [Candidatus Eisenbacteria bacterium]